MIPKPVWPEHVRIALREERFEHVLHWIDSENLPDTGLLQAAVYEWSGKPMAAAEVLTRSLKSLSLDKQLAYIWYRGLMYTQASMPALAEYDFDAVLYKKSAHPELARLARAYARVLMGDAVGALEDVDGLPHDTVLSLDRVVTPTWVHLFAMATLNRIALKEGKREDAMI